MHKLRAIAPMLAMLPFAFASAATFNVTTTVDGGPGSLRQAIIDANASPGPDIINVPAGTYVLTIPGTNENAAATGDLDITDDATINGAGATATIIDANAIDRVFEVRGTATAVTMSGLTVRNGRVDGTSGTLGGGINVATNATLTLVDVVVTANTSLAGAGIASNGAIVLDHAAVTNNVNNSANNSGGGIRGTTLTATDSTISGNSAPGQGGGIFVGTLTLDRSTVSGNVSTADQGGGIFTINGTVTITNSTISGNSAPTDEGGGIFNNPPIGAANSVTIVNTTISNNTAQIGGGIFTFTPGAFTLKNTIVAGNNAASSPDCAGDVVSQGNNLIQDTTGCNIGGTLTGNITGSSALLGPLANNGGPTQTHGLLAGSPAIDAGTSSGAPAIDQRGVARPVGAAFDVGSFEGTLGGGGLPALSITNVAVAEGNAGSTTFTFVVTLDAPSASTVSVDFATADGTATAGSDYVATSGTLTFTPGQTTRTIDVQVIGDTTPEGNETFSVNLSNATNATIAVATGTGTILDDDQTAAPLVRRIPTLGEWALMVLAAALVLVAVRRLRLADKRTK
jgi:predicted outer membrane repeat protein